MLNLRQLAWDRNLDQADMAAILQCSQPTISHYYTGRREVSRAHLARLVEHFGEDVISAYDITPQEYASLGRYSVRTGNVLGNVVTGDYNRVGEVTAENIEIKETISIPSEVINSEGIDLQKGISDGTIEMEVIPTQDTIPPHNARIITDTDEMSPKIEANDPVYVRFLPSVNDFEDGRMYLVDLEHGSFIRWVKRVDAENIKLYSMRCERVIPLASVKSLAKVEMIAKRPETLPKDRSTLQEVINRKDAQLNTALEQQGQLIQQQGELIQILKKQS